MQSYTDNANGNGVFNSIIFLISFEINMGTCSFGKNYKTGQSISLQKIFLLSNSYWVSCLIQLTRDLIWKCDM